MDFTISHLLLSKPYKIKCKYTAYQKFKNLEETLFIIKCLNILTFSWEVYSVVYFRLLIMV